MAAQDSENLHTNRIGEPDPLTPRQQEILGIVVREYVDTAEPVGSTTIVRKHALGVSSATIRNELAYLEEQGYVMQPHTSAGRVPTEKGYRYFVSRLMDEIALPLEEQRMIRHQFYQVQMDLEQWMRLTAAVLAHAARGASLVTAPHVPQTRLKHVKLIAVSDALALIVMVLHGGTFRQAMISPLGAVSQEELERVANRMNALFQGLTAAEIESREAILNPLERLVLDSVLEIMWDEEQRHTTRLYRDGLMQVLQHPEFAEAERARHLVQVLEEGSLLEPILMEASERAGVQVIIGGEGRWQDMRGYSIVLSRYGIWGRASGALGVLGPLRMPYRRTVSVVRYMARLLGELLGEFF